MSSSLKAGLAVAAILVLVGGVLAARRGAAETTDDAQRAQPFPLTSRRRRCSWFVEP
jgi:hypothetical protein